MAITPERSEEYITYDGLESDYGIKKNTAYALVSQERIPHIRIGPRFIKFRRSAIEEWLKSREVKPKLAV